MTAARPTATTASGPQIEEEFERFAVSLVGAKTTLSISQERRSDLGTRGPRPSISAQVIYEHALGLVEREGIDALTVRRLAAELKISTRTLYKRMGSRTTMIGELINMHSTRLNLGFQRLSTWEETSWAWCLQLHQAFTAKPHLTHMSQGHTPAAVTTYVNALIEATVAYGVPRKIAAECCWSLADLTINDSIKSAHMARNAASLPHAVARRVEPSKTATDAIKWILRGVRTEARSTATERNRA